MSHNEDKEEFEKAMEALGMSSSAPAPVRVEPEAEEAGVPIAVPGRPTIDDMEAAEVMALAFTDAGQGRKVLSERASSVEDRGWGTPMTHGSARKVQRRIERGEVIPDREMDLHGYTVAGAQAKFERLLRISLGSGHRVLRVICGRGNHSSGRAVVRDEVYRLVQSDEWSGSVERVVTAPGRMGSDGVLYIFLRRAPRTS